MRYWSRVSGLATTRPGNKICARSRPLRTRLTVRVVAAVACFNIRTTRIAFCGRSSKTISAPPVADTGASRVEGGGGGAQERDERAARDRGGDGPQGRAGR